MLEWTYRQIRRFVIAVLGMTLLLIGIALLALPGPGVLFIAASLAVLAIEFVWARQLLKRLREAVPNGVTRAGGPAAPASPGEQAGGAAGSASGSAGQRPAESR